MAGKKKIPEIRFKGFSGEWEDRELGTEVAEIFGGGTPSTLNPAYWNGEIDWYSPTEIGAEVYANGSVKKITELGLKNSSAKILPAGKTILFTSRAGIGDMAILQRPGATNQGFQSLILKDGYDTYFIYSSGPFIKLFAEKYSSGSTFMEISGKKLGQMIIKTPSLIEQSQIGTFFLNLDSHIAQHQRKYDKLTTVKKSMLEKMFPKDGADVPEIRFKRVTGKWERKKLGDIGAVQTCKRIFKEETTESGDIPFYKNGTLGLKADAYISREVFEEYKKLYPYPRVGDVLVSVVGSIGRTAEYRGADEYFQDSNVIWLKTESNIIDKIFLKISYQIIDWLVEGSTIKHLYNDNILASKIWIPSSLEEQTKIAAFFQNLDSLISLQQQELDKLKNIKKACLEKMFV